MNVVDNSSNLYEFHADVPASSRGQHIDHLDQGFVCPHHFLSNFLLLLFCVH